MDTQFSSSRHAKNLNTICCDILKKKKNLYGVVVNFVQMETDAALPLTGSI